MGHPVRRMVVAAIAMLSLAGAATVARADVVTVSSVANIMGAGYAVAPGEGILPVAIALAPGAQSVSFTSVTGLISFNIGTGSNFNNADGVGAAVGSSYNSGYLSLSAITMPGAGNLLGVFEFGGTPTGAAPAPISYSASDLSFAPLINQVFFIGDGLTGNGSGSLQTFYVPTGATVLYLGIADACGYSGFSSCFADNTGSFTVTYAVESVPAPLALLLVGTGLVGLARVRRRS